MVLLARQGMSPIVLRFVFDDLTMYSAIPLPEGEA